MRAVLAPPHLGISSIQGGEHCWGGEEEEEEKSDLIKGPKRGGEEKEDRDRIKNLKRGGEEGDMIKDPKRDLDLAKTPWFST
jgi:hypothetical protein